MPESARTQVNTAAYQIYPGSSKKPKLFAVSLEFGIVEPEIRYPVERLVAGIDVDPE